jgi:hypothetical protein
LPLPGALPPQQSQSSPLPGSAIANVSSKSAYQSLPISAEEAKVRIEELKTLLLISSPQAIQDRIYNTCEWLTEMAEAHNKLANAFGRQDTTKSIAATERASAHTFSQLKNEAQLLKAELLIKQNRAPEALGSLVDIISADPKSATGQAAYQQLKELGFSENAPETAISPNADQLDEPVKTSSKVVKPAVASIPLKKLSGHYASPKTKGKPTIVKVGR